MFTHGALKRVLVYAGICAAIFSLLAVSLRPANAKTQTRRQMSYRVQFTSNISYGPYPDETLDQCVPLNAPPARPGIIMIHGGGWTTGDKSSYDEMCNQYAAQGFVVTTINYRLAPQYQWPDQIGDVQLAVRFMRANASSTGLNPNNMCSLGDSAGAHLALLLDELQFIHNSDVSGYYPNTSPTVQCVVDQFGPTDLAQLYNENPPVRQYIYNLLDYQTPPGQIYQDASPLDQLDPHTGPVFITQGTQDTVVLPDQSQELQQALQSDNIPVEYVSYDGGHGYSGLTQRQIDVIMGQINTFLVSYEQP
jgi:acetyl esterase/lipase